MTFVIYFCAFTFASYGLQRLAARWIIRRNNETIARIDEILARMEEKP